MTTFAEFLKGKPIVKPFTEIEELAHYFDAVTEFVRREYIEYDSMADHGFVGFINEEIRVRISKDVHEVVCRNRFGSSLTEILIPVLQGESKADQEMRKLFYHIQFRKTMKASQTELAHSLFGMLEPQGIKTLLQRYGRPERKKRTGKRPSSR
jgi:hypothetical protein